MVLTLFTLNAYLWLLELFWVGWRRGIWFWSGPDLWELKELNGPELSPQLSQTSSEGRYDLGEGKAQYFLFNVWRRVQRFKFVWFKSLPSHNWGWKFSFLFLWIFLCFLLFLNFWIICLFNFFCFFSFILFFTSFFSLSLSFCFFFRFRFSFLDRFGPRYRISSDPYQLSPSRVFPEL